MTDSSVTEGCRISVLICTRNRANSLRNCLASLEVAASTLGVGRVEIIVVDNGSVDETAEVIRAFAGKTAAIFRSTIEPRSGLSHARNTALNVSQGDILVFTDDDCIIPENYLVEVDKYYAESQALVIRGGRVDLGDPADAPLSYKSDSQGQRFCRTSNVSPGGFIMGCNFTMQREVARLVGEFDPRFGAGGPCKAAEDTDYIVRAYKKGIAVEYVPDMRILHFHGRKGWADISATHFNYDFGNGALMMKHALSDPWLLKHFYWVVRGSLFELFGGRKFDPYLGISHRRVLRANVAGAGLFTWIALFGRRHVAARR